MHKLVVSTNCISCNSMFTHSKVYLAKYVIAYSTRQNFCGASGHGHDVLYTASDSMEKLLRLDEKLQKYSKSFAVYSIYDIIYI